MKRLAVTPDIADQLDDPTGACPALADGLGGIACFELPAHPAAVAGLNIADLNREVAVGAGLGDDLRLQRALVVFDRQEQVGALLRGELKKRWRGVQRISLDQHTVELQGAEQGFDGSALVGFAGVKRSLGNRHTQLSGEQRDLGDKTSGAVGTIGQRS